jgi:hypothetical protein
MQRSDNIRDAGDRPAPDPHSDATDQDRYDERDADVTDGPQDRPDPERADAIIPEAPRLDPDPDATDRPGATVPGADPDTAVGVAEVPGQDPDRPAEPSPLDQPVQSRWDPTTPVEHGTAADSDQLTAPQSGPADAPASGEPVGPDTRVNATDARPPGSAPADTEGAFRDRADTDRADTGRADTDRPDTGQAGTQLTDPDRAETPQPPAGDVATAPAAGATTDRPATTPDTVTGTVTDTAPGTVTDTAAGTSGPVLGPERATEFTDRWREVQASFVDDPAGAVRAADVLFAEVVSALTTALDERQRTLGGQWRDATDAGTEELRGALMRYRVVFQRLIEV